MGRNNLFREFHALRFHKKLLPFSYHFLYEFYIPNVFWIKSVVYKVHIFWEGDHFFRNLHSRFVLCSNDQIYGGEVEISQNFVAFSEYMNFTKNVPIKSSLRRSNQIKMDENKFSLKSSPINVFINGYSKESNCFRKFLLLRK